MNEKLIEQVDSAISNCKLIRNQQAHILRDNLNQLRRQVELTQGFHPKDPDFYFDTLDIETESSDLNQNLAKILHFLYYYFEIDNTTQK